MKYIHDFTIVSNERQTTDFVVLTLQAGEAPLPEIHPGQFAEVRIDGAPGVYLRRPLSIHDVDYDKQQIKLLVQEVGKGTKILTQQAVGSMVNMVYPLGKGYDLPDSKRVLLVGGGCGVAPLLFLGRHLKKNGISLDSLLVQEHLPTLFA